jgi:hypothetical protein
MRPVGDPLGLLQQGERLRREVRPVEPAEGRGQEPLPPTDPADGTTWRIIPQGSAVATHSTSVIIHLPGENCRLLWPGQSVTGAREDRSRTDPATTTRKRMPGTRITRHHDRLIAPQSARDSAGDHEPSPVHGS